MPKSSRSDTTAICLHGSDVTAGEPSLEPPLQNFKFKKGQVDIWRSLNKKNSDVKKFWNGSLSVHTAVVLNLYTDLTL